MPKSKQNKLQHLKKAAIERQLRERLELQRQHAEQMRYKAMRQQAEKEEEDEFRRQMLAKFAEDDRIEQMNAQKRRMKQLEHKRAVEQLIEDRRKQFSADREKELEERRLEEQMEAFRKQIIEEERQKLLREHAIRLLGYLPKGVIRDTGDLAMLGSDFQEQYKKRQIDPFDDEAWEAGAGSQSRK
ncbi:meiosis-specific nuclear structural protein 1-like [Lingula anatina]|uniref:Meiosis-specific nuclear structural protein 1 n=1 Tax=Lingula anatina TaxID=7574 RepID=A0A1S3IM86_LINAN|nr:meiosis-specific nuclear structural protein 1-like [Lingula anatina]|eukprot:XP_013399198.1 meiosis-specific nuclear structural protein 1-like [Lingula anatina]